MQVSAQETDGNCGCYFAVRHYCIAKPENETVILKTETYNFHRLDLTRQAGFIVTVYDEDGLRLGTTMPCSSPTEAFGEARKIVDNKVEGPRK